MQPRKVALAISAGAIVIIGLASTATKAKAITYTPITYTLTNVPLSDGGVLNGTFTLDTQYGGIKSYDLMTSGGLLLPEVYTYSPSYPPPSAKANPFGAPTALTFYPNANPDTNYELDLVFSGNLLNGGVNLLGAPYSYECINSFNCYSAETGANGSILYVSFETFGSAALTATPLPGTWTAMLVGLAGLGFLRYRAKKSRILTIAA